MKLDHENLLNALEQAVKQSAIEKYCNEVLPNNIVNGATVVKQYDPSTNQEHIQVFFKINGITVDFKMYPKDFPKNMGRVNFDDITSISEAISAKLTSVLSQFVSERLAKMVRNL